jgi:hypothetical protein
MGVSDLVEHLRLRSAVRLVGANLDGWQLVALAARKLPVSFRPAPAATSPWLPVQWVLPFDKLMSTNRPVIVRDGLARSQLFRRVVGSGI